MRPGEENASEDRKAGVAGVVGAMDDLLQEFLAETVGDIAAFDRDLNRLLLDPADPELLARLSRVVHTIRGTSGFAELPRPEERRFGKACVRTCRSERAPEQS